MNINRVYNLFEGNCTCENFNLFFYYYYRCIKLLCLFYFVCLYLLALLFRSSFKNSLAEMSLGIFAQKGPPQVRLLDHHLNTFPLSGSLNTHKSNGILSLRIHYSCYLDVGNESRGCGIAVSCSIAKARIEKKGLCIMCLWPVR